MFPVYYLHCKGIAKEGKKDNVSADCLLLPLKVDTHQAFGGKLATMNVVHVKGAHTCATCASTISLHFDEIMSEDRMPVTKAADRGHQWDKVKKNARDYSLGRILSFFSSS